MLKIRLTRVGKKNSPAYRVVVAEQKKAVKRKFIEILGHYNPASTPKELIVKNDRAKFWIERGAQPSSTVHNLFAGLGIIDAKINKIYGKPTKKKGAGKKGEATEENKDLKNEIIEETTETEEQVETVEKSEVTPDETVETSEPKVESATETVKEPKKNEEITDSEK